MIVSLMTRGRHRAAECNPDRPHIAPCRLSELTSIGFSPTVSNFNVLLKSCMITRDVSRAESVMQQISDSGLQVCVCPLTYSDDHDGEVIVVKDRAGQPSFSCAWH